MDKCGQKAIARPGGIFAVYRESGEVSLAGRGSIATAAIAIGNNYHLALGEG